MSLSKLVRGDMLHSFFMDVTEQPRLDLKKIENELALYVYNLIYGGFDLSQVPKAMLRMESTLPLPTVYIKAKKAKRKKGSIEPSKGQLFAFMRFSTTISNIDCAIATFSVDALDLPESLPQAHSPSRYGRHHLEHLKNIGLANKTMLKLIEARYIRGCKEAAKIVNPIVKVMDGVTEILSTIKTTKGLLAAWPGCEKYLTLPEESSGALMKVDVKALNDSLSSMYPPAKKNSLADEL